MTARTSRLPIRRLVVLATLLVVLALPVTAALAAPGDSTTTPSVTSMTTATSLKPTTTFRPTTTVRPSVPSTSVPKPTTTLPKPTTTQRFTSTLPTTTLAPTTVVPTTAPESTTTVPPSTTTTKVAPVKEAEASSGSGRLPLVVGGLLGVGAAIATLTFLFWRHTRPEYDDYYPYDDELDDAAADPDALAVSAVDEGVTPIGGTTLVGAAAGGAVAGAGVSTLTRSAYPPDDKATVVVKPLSELHEATSPRDSGGSLEPVADGSSSSEAQTASKETVGADVAGFAEAGLVVGAAVAASEVSSDDGPDTDTDTSFDTDAGDVPLSSRFTSDRGADAVAGGVANLFTDEEAAAARPATAGDNGTHGDDEPHDDESGDVPITVDHRDDIPIDDIPIDDLPIDDRAIDDRAIDDEIAHAEHEQGSDEHDLTDYGEADQHEADQHEADHLADDDDFVAGEPAIAPVAVATPPAPSAVTILGPMRPGKQVDDEARHGILEPDPLEIVTLEDIEQARAGSRRGDRG